MKIKTRFAPSPTGFLHIGGARTAIYNYIFAKQNFGDYFVRIEDTDKERSTNLSIKAIIDGLNWLKINSNLPIIYQSKNIDRHKRVAETLLNQGHAYKCYLTFDEQNIIKQECIKKGQPFKSPWRDKKETFNKDYVVRLKMPQKGVTNILDLIQGKVSINNTSLDDMVILRSDGTPTYMLAVVVDDYDMGITHIIRGDDHLNNAFRQIWVYKSMNWEIPNFAHIPLIHGQDGKKLSKRHSALGVHSYKDDGILPNALNCYLLNLGWGNNNEDELIDLNKAISRFNLSSLGRSPSRFDLNKLQYVNSYFLKNTPIKEILKIFQKSFKKVSDENKKKIIIALPILLNRISTTNELIEESKWIFIDKFTLSNKDLSQISSDKLHILSSFNKILPNKNLWSNSEAKLHIENWLSDNNLKFKDIGPILRICLTGKVNAPDLANILFILGPKETSKRITKFLNVYN